MRALWIDSGNDPDCNLDDEYATLTDEREDDDGARRQADAGTEGIERICMVPTGPSVVAIPEDQRSA